MGVELFEPTQVRIRNLVGFPIVDADVAVGANINADKIGTGVVSNTEFNLLNGLTSPIVSEDAVQTLTQKTLTTPTIASFVNAGHDHENAAGGGTLVATLALTATGTKDTTTFLRGDDTWAVPPGGGASQSPWLTNIDADGFDLQDLSNIEFRISTGIPGATVPAIYWDATRMTFNVPSGDNFEFSINNIDEYTFNATDADFNNNNLINVTIVTPTIASFTNAQHDHEDAAGGGNLVATAISDFDTEVSNNASVTANTAKVTNATHTGDVTGSVALTLESVAITGQATVTAITGDFILISDTSDSGNLKKVNASDFLGGASQSPWLTNIDADGFHLQDFGALEFRDPTATLPAGTVHYIGVEANGIVINVPTGDRVAIKENGALTIFIDTDGIDMIDEDIVRINLISFSIPNINITDTTSDLLYNVPIGGSHDLRINTVAEYVFDVTQADFNNNNIINLPGTFISALTTVTGISGDFVMISDTTDSGNLKKVDVSDFLSGASQTPWTSDIDGDGFDLNDLSNLEFRDPSSSVSGPTVNAIYVEAAGMVFNVPTGNNFVFSVNDVNQMVVDFAEITIPTNNFRLSSGFISIPASSTYRFASNAQDAIAHVGGTMEFRSASEFDSFEWILGSVKRFEANKDNLDMIAMNIRWTTTNRAIINDATGFDFRVETGDNFDFQIQTVSQLTLDANDLTLVLADLTLSAGNINMVDNTDIQWGGSADRKIKNTTGGFEFEVETGDTFQFTIQDTNEMTLSATGLDLQFNKLIDIGTTTITDLTTVTAVSGDFVWIIDATDGLSKKANASDFLGGGSQTPWLSDIDSATFDLLLKTNSIVGTDAGQTILTDGAGWQFEVPTGDVHKFIINGVLAFQLGATVLDYQNKDAHNVADITMQSNQLHTVGISRFEILADDTDIGIYTFRAFDGLSAIQNYARIVGTMESDVDTTEDGSLKFYVTKDGTHDELMLSLNDGAGGRVEIGANAIALDLNNVNLTEFADISSGGDTLHSINLSRNATLADDTVIGRLRFQAFDGVAGLVNYVRMQATMVSDVDAAEEGSLRFYFTEGGVHEVLKFAINDGGNNLADFLLPLDMNTNNIINLPGTFISALTTVTALSGDFIMISDTSDSGNLKKVNALDFLGGASQSPWLSNIDADNFDLLDLGNITFTDNTSVITWAAGETISIQTNDMVFDVTTADNFIFAVNGVTEMSLTTSILDLPTNTSITWAGNGDRRILNSTGGFLFEIQTGDIFQFQVNSINEWDFSAASLDAHDNNIINLSGTFISALTTVTPVSGDFILISDTSDTGDLKKVDALDFLGGGQTPWVSDIDADGNSLQDLDTIEFRDNVTPPAGTIANIYWDTAAGMVHNVPAGDEFRISVNAVGEYTFDSTIADWNGNDLREMGVLSFDDVNTTITQVGAVLELEVATGATIVMRVNAVVEYNFSSTVAQWNGNNLDGVARLSFGATTQSIQIESSDMIFDVTTTNEFSFDIAGVPEMILDGGSLDLIGNVLIWGLAGVGHTITPGTTTWDFNAAVSTDVLSLQTGAVDRFQVNGATDLQAFLPLDMNSNNITALPGTFISALTTVTALSGDFIMISDTSDSGNLKKVNALDFLGGGSQSPWTTTIDAADFSLTNLDILNFNERTDTITALAAEIYWEAATGMKFNVPTFDNFEWRENNGIIMALDDIELDLRSANIVWNETGFDHSINVFAASMNITTGNAADTFSIVIGAGSQIIVSSTQIILADDVLINGGTLTLTTTNDLIFGSGGSIQFATAGTSITMTGSNDMQFDVTSNDFFDYQINGVSEFSIGENSVDLNRGTGKDLFMGSGQLIRWNDEVDRSISNSATGFVFDVQVGDTFSFDIAGTPEMSLSATLLNLSGGTVTDVSLGNGAELQWVNSNRKIVNDATGFVFDVEAADTFLFDIATVNEYTFSATQLDLQFNKLADIGTATITDLTTVTAVTGDFIWIIDATDGLSKKANASDFLGGGSQSPWLTDIDADGNSLQDLDTIEFRDNVTPPAGTVAYILHEASAEGIVINSIAGDEITFKYNNIINYQFNVNKLDTNNNDVDVGTGAVEFNGAGQIIEDGVLGLEYNVPTGDNHTFRINNVEEYSMSATVLDLKNNLLQFAAGETIGMETNDMIFDVTSANFFEFHINGIQEILISATVLDLSGDHSIRWAGNNSRRIFNDGGGTTFRVETADTYDFEINAVAEMVLNATELNLQNNKLANVNPTTITDFTTVTAVSGDFIWIIDATDGLSKKADASDFLGGGSQSPWVADIDAANFSLRNLDLLEFNENVDVPVITNAEIYWDSLTGMQFNVPTGDHFQYRINGVAEMTLDSTTLNLSANHTIQWGGNANARISNGAAGTVFEVDSGDIFDWEVNNLTEMTLNATELNMQANNIFMGDSTEIRWATDANRRIFNSAVGFIFEVATGDQFDFHQNSVSKMTLQTSSLDLKSIDLDLSGGSLVSWAGNANRSITNGVNGFDFEVETGDSYNFQINSLIEYDLTAATFDLSQTTATNILLANGAILQWVDSTRQIVNDTGGFDFDVPTGDNFDFNIGGSTSEFVISEAVVSVGSGVLLRVDSDATDAGFQDLGHTADPSSPLSGNMYYNTTANEFRFYDGTVWQSMKASGGGATIELDNLGTTAVNAQINMGANNLDFTTGQVTWAAGESISIQGGDMTFDVATTDFFSFDIAGITEFELTDVSLDVLSNNIDWSAVGYLHSIDVTATTMDINTGATTDTLSLQTGATDRLQIIGSTNIDILLPTDFNGNQITLGSTANVILFGVGESIGMEANDMVFDITAADTFQFHGNGVEIARFSNVGLILPSGFKVQVDSSTAEAGFFDLGHTADPSSATKGDMYMNTTANEFRFFDGTVWQSMKASGGSEVFTWTADHSTGGNALILTDDAAPPASTIASIYAENTNDITFNVPTSAIYQFKFNGTNEITIGALVTTFNAMNLGMSDSQAIIWAGSRRIFNNTTGFIFDVDTGDNFDFHVNDVSKMILDNGSLALGTGLHMTIPAGESYRWNNIAEDAIAHTGNVMEFKTATAGDTMTWDIATVSQMTLSETALNIGNNTLGAVGAINVNAGGKITVDTSTTTAGHRDIGHTADPSSPATGDMYFNTTSNEYRSFNGATWDPMIGGGGSEVFTWTADHDAADFDLLQVDNITSGAANIHNWDLQRDEQMADDTEIGSIRFRSNDGLGATMNYARIQAIMESDIDASESGGLHFFIANGAGVETEILKMISDPLFQIEIVNTLALVMPDAFILRWTGSVNRTLINNSGGFEFRVETGDTFDFLVQGTSEMILNATALDIQNNNLVMGTGQIQFNDADETIRINAGNFEYDLPTGGSHRFRVNNLTTVTIDGGALTMTPGDNIILGTGSILQWAAGESIGIESNDMIFDVTTGNNFTWAVNGVTEMVLSGTSLNLSSGSLKNILLNSTSGELRWATNRKILNNPSGFIFEVETSDDFRLEINSVVEFSFDAAGMDLNTNNIVQAGNITMQSGMKLSGNSDATEAAFFDAGHTADPSSPTAGDLYYNTTVNKFKFYNGTAWFNVDEGGAAQTPWAQTIDAAGFELDDVGKIDFNLTGALGLGTEAYIVADAGGFTSNVATGLVHDFRVNNSSVLQIGTTISFFADADLNDRNIIDVQNFTFFDNGGVLTWAAGETISIQSNDMIFDVTAADFFSFDVAGVPQMSINSSSMDLKGNNIFGASSYQGNDANQSATGVYQMANTNSIGWRNAGNSGDITLTVNASDQFVFSSGILNATLITPTIASFTNATHDHSNAAGGGNLTNTALTSGVFAAITGLGAQTQNLDMDGFIIFDLQYLESDFANPATSGFLRMGNNESIRWRNAANDGNLGIEIDASDLFGFVATEQFQANIISNHSTVTAVAGDFILILDATDTTIKKVNASDFLGGGEVFTWTADHSTGGNSLIFTADATPPAGSVVSIYLDSGADLNLNVTTGQTIELSVNGTDEYAFTATQADFNGNSLVDLGILQFATGETISMETNDMIFNVTTTNFFSFDIAGTPEVSITGTALIINLNNLQFNDVNTTIVQVGADLRYNIASGSHFFRIGAVAELTVNSGATILGNGNDLSLLGSGQLLIADGSGIEWAADVNRRIFNNTTGFIFEVPTGDNFDWQINSVNQMLLDVTGLDLASGLTFQENGVNISPIGTHDLYFDGGAFISVDAGTKAEILIGTTTNRKGVLAIPFPTAASSFATVKIIPPRNWDHGTITVVVHWTSTTEGSGTVQWEISGVAAGDGDDLAGAATNYGTLQTATDTQSTINFEQISPRSAAITIANTPIDGDDLYLKVNRNTADTFGEDAYLLGVTVAFGLDAAVAA